VQEKPQPAWPVQERETPSSLLTCSCLKLSVRSCLISDARGTTKVAMTPDDRATILRLITATIHQYGTIEPRDLAEHIADDIETAGYEITNQNQPRPHTWPQTSAISGGRAHCIVCGAAYGGTRAQGPCEPRE
jgi:hypothetical protein